MLLKPDLVIRALRQHRCVRTLKELAPDESLVSRGAFPSLYDGSNDDSQAAYLESLFRAIPDVLAQTSEPELRERVRHFMGMVIDNRHLATEWHLHAYLFNFWDEAWVHADEAIPLAELYCEGNAGETRTQFADAFLPGFTRARAYPDILGIGAGRHARELVVVEVKLDDIDDRAVGQILRYYSLGRRLCDRTHHGCDIRRVTPVLVARRFSLSFWETLPPYFRELLRICSFSVEPKTRRVRLVDARRSIDTQLRERLIA
jgi:hypothetical protein